MFQLPTTIHSKWKSSVTTCFEIRLADFFMVFPIGMSCILLFVISIDRYIFIMHSSFHRKHATRMFLTIMIIFVTFISIMWTVLHIFLRGNQGRTKAYIALKVYSGILVITAVFLNMALLQNAKQKLNTVSVDKQSIQV